MREIDRKYSIKRKKHVKTTTFVALLVAATMILSGAVTGITMMMNEKTTMNANIGENAKLGASDDGDRLSFTTDEPELCAAALEQEHSVKERGYRAIVWDNGLGYTNMGSAQDDTQYPMLSEIADDFQFAFDQAVQDVHWVGGYWNGVYPAPFDWRIRFYKDSGGVPGTLYGGPFEFAWDDIDKIDLGGGYYEMSVYIPTVIFNGGVKYWISIQGVGFFPPQSGWAMHTGIQLSEGMFKSAFFGYPDWTPASVVGWGTVDFCFQLTFSAEHDVGVSEIKHPAPSDEPGCPCIPVEVEVSNWGATDEFDVPVHVEIHRNLMCTSFPCDDYNVEWNFEGDECCNWQFVTAETWFPYAVTPNKGDWMAELNQHGCTGGVGEMITHEPVYLCDDCLDPYLKFYMWHDDYGSDDYIDVWVSTTGKYGVYTQIGGPYERLCCPGCEIGWKEHRISLEEFICNPIWIKFMGHCDGTPSAYNLHIDDVCVFDLEYMDTKYVDLEAGEVKQVEFDCWPAECWWCQYENEDVEFWVGAYTMMEGDENPGNDGWGPCQNAYKQTFIHIPWTHDVGDKEIEYPDEDYYYADEPIKMKQKIKNYGKEPEGCFYVYMAVRDLTIEIDLDEEFNNWEDNPEGAGSTSDDRPVGWRDINAGYGSYYDYGWEDSYTSNAGGTSPEARLYWSYANTYYDNILESPAINTLGEGKLELEFKSFIDDYSGGCYFYVEARADGGDSWTDYTPWDNPINGNVGPDTYLVDITDEIGPGSQVRFRFYGYYFDFDYWYVDDVKFISYTCGEEIYYQEKVCVDYIDVCEELNVPFPDWEPEPPYDCYCGTWEYCIQSWTKMLDPPDQNTANDMKQKFITVEFLHDVGIVEFTAPVSSPVGGAVLFEQLPHDPEDAWSIGTSDAGMGYKVYENYWDVDGKIGDVHWWGLALVYSGGWTAGNPANLDFDISFYEDDGTGHPGAEEAYFADVACTYTGTGLYYAGFEMYYWECDPLPSCVNLGDGLVAIQSQSAGQGYDCFLWHSAKTGDGFSYQEGSTTPDTIYDRAVRLTECEGGGGDEVPEPEVYIACGDGDLSVLIKNFGTYDESPVVVDWKLFEYQPAKTEVASGTYNTALDAGDTEDCLLGTYAFAADKVYELEVEVNLVPPSMDCNLDNNGPETLIIGVDCCEPDCCFVLDPEDPDGENNWYISDVTVTVDAWDTCEIQSGISHIVYILDGVMNTITGDHGDFVIDEDGVHHGTVYAVDNVGHEGVHHTFEVAIDTTDPTIELVYTKYTDEDTGTNYVEFTALAGDSTSGMNRVEFTIDGVLKETIPGAGPYVFTVDWSGYDQNTQVCAKAFDNAGNDASDCQDGIKFGKDRSQSQTRSKTLPVSRIILNLGR